MSPYQSVALSITAFLTFRDSSFIMIYAGLHVPLKCEYSIPPWNDLKLIIKSPTSTIDQFIKINAREIISTSSKRLCTIKAIK